MKLEDLEENFLVKDNYSHPKNQIRTDPKGKRKTTVIKEAKEREYPDKDFSTLLISSLILE